MTSPTLYNGVDASRPAGSLPIGTQILCAYVGIPNQFGPDTPHIWTADEWNQYIEADPDLRVLPIYTHNYPGNAIGDANNAADACEQLGWSPNLIGNQRRIIAVDLEIMVDPLYVHNVFAQIEDRGFDPMPYGSTFYVEQNPPGIGYWTAGLMQHAPTILPPRTQGVQWQWGTWDRSVFSQRVYDGCGRGLRHTS